MMRKAVSLLLATWLGVACSSTVPADRWSYPWTPLPPETSILRPEPRAMSDDEARHLLRRTGFGVATPIEMDSIRGLDYEAAVDRLLDGMRPLPATGEPAWKSDIPLTPKERAGLSTDELNANRDLWLARRPELKAWWVGEMLATPSPLTERMTLFWHNHFTSGMKKVNFASFMYQQNALFRREAAGSFAVLLREVSKGPAMLIYLDNRDNRDSHPNENFARELLELFTLGEGHGYTEKDIREAARAFTGWRVDPDWRRFQNFIRFHDYGSKTFLGRTGNFDGDDILTILLHQPRTAEYVAERLWREFIDDTPARAEVERLAEIFRRSGYRIRPLLKALLMSPAFRDPATRGVLVKAPVDVVVGTYRLMGRHPDELRPLVGALARMGQDLFDPPNVKGWPGGLHWITATTLGQRQQFLNGVLRQTLRGAGDGGGQAMMANAGMESRMDVQPVQRASWDPLKTDPASLYRALLAVPPVAPAAPQSPPERRLRLALLDPAFELK